MYLDYIRDRGLRVKIANFLEQIKWGITDTQHEIFVELLNELYNQAYLDAREDIRGDE